MKLIITIVVLAVLGSIGGTGYFYYTSTQKELKQLRENAVRMEEANKTMAETMSKLQQDAERNAKLNKQLSSALQQAEGKLDKLRMRFSEIDLAAEARKDPVGLAIRVNRAVDRLREELKNETTQNISEPTNNSSTSTK